MGQKKEERGDSLKNIARLIICQALHMFYDSNNEEKNIAKILSIIDEYYINYIVKDYYLSNNITKSINSSKYKVFYNNKFTIGVINLVLQSAERFDAEIKKYLARDEPFETLDLILIQILRSALAEAELHPNLDKNIIINGYVDIAGKFYDNVYVSFANGVLASIFNRNKGEGKEVLVVKNKRKILSLKK
jgi:transcription termination factor NusB